jgi:altronate hydrolase
LRLLWGPGNDLVSTTALAAAGAQMVLFTTGRGTPFGGPVPTLKIASNTELFEKKPHWMDFDAGPIARGALDPAQAAERLWRQVLETASGHTLTQAERNGYRGIALMKDGVTL